MVRIGVAVAIVMLLLLTGLGGHSTAGPAQAKRAAEPFPTSTFTIHAGSASTWICLRHTPCVSTAKPAGAAGKPSDLQKPKVPSGHGGYVGVDRQTYDAAYTVCFRTIPKGIAAVEQAADWPRRVRPWVNGCNAGINAWSRAHQLSPVGRVRLVSSAPLQPN